MLALTSIGKLIKLSDGVAPKDKYLYAREIKLQYDRTDNLVDIYINSESYGVINYMNTPLSQLLIAGVTPTNQTQFDIQVALVFPNTNSGSGGDSSLSSGEVEAVRTLLANQGSILNMQ